eukprot:369754-Prymnesium_polylepis.1
MLALKVCLFTMRALQVWVARGARGCTRRRGWRKRRRRWRVVVELKLFAASGKQGLFERLRKRVAQVECNGGWGVHITPKGCGGVVAPNESTTQPRLRHAGSASSPPPQGAIMSLLVAVGAGSWACGQALTCGGQRHSLRTIISHLADAIVTPIAQEHIQAVRAHSHMLHPVECGARARTIGKAAAARTGQRR